MVVIPLIFPNVPQSSLGILRVPSYPLQVGTNRGVRDSESINSDRSLEGNLRVNIHNHDGSMVNNIRVNIFTYFFLCFYFLHLPMSLQFPSHKLQSAHRMITTLQDYSPLIRKCFSLLSEFGKDSGLSKIHP